MDKANFGQLVSFIFGIANDCLVDVYDVGDYRKIILPMIVLRRFDAVLEPSKQAVIAMKKQLDEAGITDQDEALCAAAGEAFCNSSPYVLSDLKSRTNQQQLKADFILYITHICRCYSQYFCKLAQIHLCCKSLLSDITAKCLSAFHHQSPFLLRSDVSAFAVF